MTKIELKENLIKYSPFIQEITNNKFVFKNDIVYINDGSEVPYSIEETQMGLILKIEVTVNHFFNLIVVFDKTIKSEIINYDSSMLRYSAPARSQFIGFVSTNVDIGIN